MCGLTSKCNRSCLGFDGPFSTNAAQIVVYLLIILGLGIPALVHNAGARSPGSHYQAAREIDDMLST